MVDALVVIDVVIDIFDLPVPLHEPSQFVDRIAEFHGRKLVSEKNDKERIYKIANSGTKGSRQGKASRKAR